MRDVQACERRAGSGKNKSPQMARPPYSTTHFLFKACISGIHHLSSLISHLIFTATVASPPYASF
eukprot:scaffold80418_cov36-Cyclotella_meneghiniana.AAC.1